jgi:flagellar motor switch protein FliM
MTIRNHDFSRPPSLHPETRAKLAKWMTRANAQLSEVIAANSLEIDLQLDDCTTAWPIDELATWSEKAIAFRLKLADVSTVSAIALTNPLAQILVGSLLGETPQEWPEERDLTPSELSVAEYFVTRVASSLIDSWSGDAPLALQLAEQDPNLRRTKVFKFQEPIIVCRTTMKLAIGSGQLCWMLPHDFLTKMFGTIRKSDSDSEVSARQQLETLARDMTTQLTIRLGGVQLSAPQLAELRVGDLVVLNQKTSEPLRAMVSGQTRFLGWPGRVGNRQAFEVSTDGARRDKNAETAASGQLVANH